MNERPTTEPSPPDLHQLMKGVAKALEKANDDLHGALQRPELGELGGAPGTGREMTERERRNEERRRQRLDIQLLQEQLDDLAGQARATAQRLRPRPGDSS